MKKCTRLEYNAEKLALLPLICALLVYLAVCDRDFPFSDCEEYANLAQSLAKKGKFAFSGSLTPLSSTIRTPGYPALLAMGSFAGRHAYFAINLVFLYCLVLLTLKLAKKWGRKSAWPAVLFCLSPGILVCTSVPLTEICFTFFLTACIYSLISGRILTAGLCLAFSTLVRPLSMFLFVPLGAWVLWKKRSWKAAILFVALANLLPAMWIARNYRKIGYPVYTTISGYNILYYKMGSYLSYKNDENFVQVRQNLTARLPTLSGDPVIDDGEARKLGLRLLRENFWGFCLWAPRNMLNFWLPDITPFLERLGISRGNRGTYDVLNRSGVWAAVKHYFAGNPFAAGVTAIYLAYYSLLSLTIFLGILQLIREKQSDALFFTLLLSCYFATLPLGNLDWRFRIPVTPVYFILASIGFTRRAALGAVCKMTSHSYVQA